MTRVLVFLLLACLWATSALAEIPCVSRDDAVLVIDSPDTVDLAVPGVSILPFVASYTYPKITCPPGKRVGIWITTEWFLPVSLRHVMVTGCEVGVVVGREARHQLVSQLTVKGAKVGVCWQADEGYLASTHIEATEVGIVMSGKHNRFYKGSIYIDSLDGIGIKVQEDEACTCFNAV